MANGAACIVDPNSVESIRSGIYKVISDEAYRNDLVEHGLINSEKYKASIVSSMYAEIYKSLV